jgi:hypothetical protein
LPDQRKAILAAIEGIKETTCMSRRAPVKAQLIKDSRVGDDLVKAFREMAAYLRGEVEVESYEFLTTR